MVKILWYSDEKIYPIKMCAHIRPRLNQAEFGFGIRIRIEFVIW